MGKYTENLFKKNRTNTRQETDNKVRRTVQIETGGSTEPVEQLVSCALERDGEIHKGFKSHSDLRRSLGDEDPYVAKATDRYGFWTSNDRFVSRSEAVEVGILSGQLGAEWRTVSRVLLSSDIW